MGDHNEGVAANTFDRDPEDDSDHMGEVIDDPT
jgi:hypothetical protein